MLTIIYIIKVLLENKDSKDRKYLLIVLLENKDSKGCKYLLINYGCINCWYSYMWLWENGFRIFIAFKFEYLMYKDKFDVNNNIYNQSSVRK